MIEYKSGLIGFGAIAIVAAMLSTSCKDDDESEPTGGFADGNTVGGAGGEGANGGAGGGGSGAQGGVGGVGGGGSGGQGGQAPVLEPCAGATLETFADASGGIAVDPAGNLLAGGIEFAGNQFIKGYAAADVVPGGGSATGSDVLTTTGFGGPLTAAMGRMFYQATDGGTFTPLDPIVVTYAAGSPWTATPPVAFVTMTTPGAPVSLTRDNMDRVWVGVDDGVGGMVFVVIAEATGATCLDQSEYDTYFDIATPDLCAVERHATSELSLTTLTFTPVLPTWGTHNGPLGFRGSNTPGSIEVVRLSVPTDPIGDLTATTSTIDLDILGTFETDIFLSPQLLDLPTSGWTAISYSDLDVAGEILFFDGDEMVARVAANGVFSLSHRTVGGIERIFHTGLSAIDDPSTFVNGVYAFELCER